MPSATQMINFWDMALAEPLGIWLRTPDPIRAKEHLYNARALAQRSGIRAYDDLQIRTSPSSPRDELWIVNPAPSLTDE